MSDAKKQSVARCKYRHDWQLVCADPDTRIQCSICGGTPKPKEQEQAEAVVKLREWLAPGTTVFTVLKHVSRSGMSRLLDVYVIRDGEPLRITWSVANAIGETYDRNKEALRVGGCGMDMGFHVVYNLGRVLYPQGFTCVGANCRSNDHFNDRSEAMYRENYAGKMHTGDGGYALNQRWM